MSQLPDPAEKEWIAAMQQGDEKAFEQLYNTYWGRLFSATWNLTRSRETAQEIVQEVFVSLWLNRAQLNIKTCLSAYLSGAVRNRVYDYLDKQSVRRRYEEYAAHVFSPAGNPTEEQAEINELQELVQQEIGVLPETTRKVFMLSRMKGFSIPEIAEETRLSVKAVEYHLTKALKHLRFRLTELLLLLLVWYLNR